MPEKTESAVTELVQLKSKSLDMTFTLVVTRVHCLIGVLEVSDWHLFAVLMDIMCNNDMNTEHSGDEGWKISSHLEIDSQNFEVPKLMREANGR